MYKPANVASVIEELRAGNEKIAKQVIDKLNSDSSSVITAAIRNETFGAKGGSLTFQDLGIYTIDAALRTILTMEIKKLFESHDWRVINMDLRSGEIPDHASLKINLSAR